MRTSLFLALLSALAIQALAQVSYPDGFTYQGELRRLGAPMNGVVDLEITLWDAPGVGSPPSGGSQIGGEILLSNTPVSEGRFTVLLNESGEFGPSAFNGSPRWLEIAVNGQTLAPRQPLTPAPYATYAAGPWKTTGANLTYQLGRVGIGVASPATPLHVLGGGDTTPTSGGNIVSGDLAGANLSIDGNEIMARNNGVVSTLSINAQGGDVAIAQSGDGNVGIGTSAPLYRLDVADRIRSRQGPDGTAGMWLYQTAPAENRAFVGMRNDTQVGLYGTEGASWGLLMDVGSGNVGVGTTSPSSRFYVLNGSGTQSALNCVQSSTGVGGAFSIINANSTNNTLTASTLGKGRAGSFTIFNTGSNASALYCSTSGDGYALEADGRSIVRTSDSFPALRIETSYRCSGDPDGGFIHCDGTAVSIGGALFSDHWIVGSVKAFRIDHPLDPANRYLMHTCVESDDMKNIYDGVVTLDEQGKATVQMPDWFEALNESFRYQLTCIGAHAPVYIATELNGGSFSIAGGVAGMKVSWQVTGVRKDAFAEAYRVPVEPFKAEHERGRYLHPELVGQPESLRIDGR